VDDELRQTVSLRGSSAERILIAESMALGKITPPKHGRPGRDPGPLRTLQARAKARHIEAHFVIASAAKQPRVA